MKKFLLSIAICALFAGGGLGQTVLLNEGFETDGHGIRYTASSGGGFNSGDTSHFRRTDGSDLKTSGTNPYSEVSGTYFWAADDTDHFTGDGMGEQTIVFNPIDIAGVTGLSVSGLFGAANDLLPGVGPGSEGYSPEAYLRLTYQIDLGEETDVLCFRHEDHGNNRSDPFGLDANCDGTADNLDGTGRLGAELTAYSANIPETGDSLRVHATGTDEDMAFDDIKVTEISLTPQPDSQPTTFMATAAGPSQIDLSWTDATGTNAPTGYVIYANETGTFTALTDGTPPTIDTDLSDGTAVVAVDQGTGTYSFTGLTAGTTYHFQILAYSGTGSGINYLTDPAGPTVSAVPVYPQPDNHPTTFMATATSPTQIDLSWTDATGANAPTGYVIYANETGTFTAPTDGTPPTIDTDLSDGTAVVTVNHGAGSAYSFPSLTALTTYHFQIWAYSNAGSNIDYLTSLAGPMVSTATPDYPEPDNHPIAFMATAAGPTQINLNWTNATGMSEPTGYVIYASTTNALSAPTNGTPPVLDADLSNGDAVVTVNHDVGSGGTGSIYTFTSLMASTAYYFQIWAYSGTGNNIGYLTSSAGPEVSVTTKEPQTVILEEGFETDGHPGRYTAGSSGGFRDGNNAHFQRTDGDNIANESGAYTGFADMHFWAAEQIGANERIITFNSINIAGWTDLSISGLFGAGNENPPTPTPPGTSPPPTFSYDEAEYIRVSYEIDDSGTETDVLCFRYEYHGDGGNEPFGLDADCSGTADNNGVNRLGTALATYSANIPETGNSLTVRIKVHTNGPGEEMAFDDIKVAGTLKEDPEPSEHPTTFMATATSPTQIDLSWTDVTGANVPTGYIIYANDTGTFTAPTDGTPPTIDTDLSDGTAVVTVNHGAGSAYSFPSLTALTTYHFQIWAYSNAGSNIDYLTSLTGPMVSTATPDYPEPDNHPTAFMATAAGPTQINLNWTNATGMSEPTGYVIYASTTNALSAPTNGTPPVLDADLSDGDAVVTVNHDVGSGGTGSIYTFTSLMASTAYYFQIWAYSGTGDNLGYLTSSAGPEVSVTTKDPQTVLLEEGFETEGHPDRYTASSNGGFRLDNNAHFRRTNGSNIANVSGAYSGFSGTHFWAAEDTEEQTITFNSINIAGWTDLSISGLFGAGNENPPTPPTGTGNTLAYDEAEYIRVSYEIDGSGTETDVLCFRYENHGDENNEPLGLDADCSGTADNNGTNRLGKALTAYSADIPGTGSMLTIKIKVVMDSITEEIAFDDIKVSGFAPQPDSHPTPFTATAAGPTQINLSWTNVAGMNAPAGYVIYANTVESSLPAPADGVPPTIDTDLSNGDAVVTVNHDVGSGGTGSIYTFTSLMASTAYYFQIWAYSNAGNRIDYLTSTEGTEVSVTTKDLQAVLREEGFETDGHPSRYTASSDGGFRATDNAHFQRTGGSNIGNVSGAYTGFSGRWFWAAEDTDGGGDGNEEQTIEFEPVNIAGVTGLSISGLFGAGNENPPTPNGTGNTSSYDRDEYIRVSYQIDGAVEQDGTTPVETDVLCFRYEYHGDGGNEPLGLDADCSGTADNNGVNRLGTALATYSADIPETGNSLTVRIKVRTNGADEEMAFDDIKVSGFASRTEQPPHHFYGNGRRSISDRSKLVGCNGNQCTYRVCDLCQHNGELASCPDRWHRRWCPANH